MLIQNSRSRCMTTGSQGPYSSTTTRCNIVQKSRFKIASTTTNAFHKSNPSTVLQGIVDSYSTLGHVRGGNSCEGHTLVRVATTKAG